MLSLINSSSIASLRATTSTPRSIAKGAFLADHSRIDFLKRCGCSWAAILTELGLKPPNTHFLNGYLEAEYQTVSSTLIALAQYVARHLPAQP